MCYCQTATKPETAHINLKFQNLFVCITKTAMNYVVELPVFRGTAVAGRACLERIKHHPEKTTSLSCYMFRQKV